MSKNPQKWMRLTAEVLEQIKQSVKLTAKQRLLIDSAIECECHAESPKLTLTEMIEIARHNPQDPYGSN